MIDLNKRVHADQQFKNIDLSNTELKEKEFDNCYFDRCNFTETSFLCCKFYQCTFVHCNLSLMNVKDSSFFDTTFEASKAIGINWTQAAWSKIKLCSLLKFYKCALNHSSFFGLYLKELVIIECDAKEVDFRESNCSEAEFTHTDFAGSFFGQTNLTKANFTDAINYTIDAFNNEIKKAKFSLPEAICLLDSLDIELVDYRTD